MQLSTKSRYGLKVMIELGIQPKNKKVSLKSIALKYKISESYLEQIVAILKKEKLVKSTRGAYGGYTLAKNINNISLGDILRALEEKFNLIKCLDERENICSQSNDCSFRYIWNKVNIGIGDIVDGMSLKELVKDHKKIVSQKKEV